MSAEKIIEQIKTDASKEVKEILKEAEKQAKEIINEAKKETNAEAEKILADGKKQSENHKKILVSQANQDAKKEIMAAKEKIIEECFVKAHHILSTLKETEYKNMVRKLMTDGVKKLGGKCDGVKKLGGKCTVIVSRDIDKQIAKDLHFEVIGNIEASGGIMLKSGDGRITLDHTFDGILKREKDQIRIKVGKLLFS